MKIQTKNSTLFAGIIVGIFAIIMIYNRNSADQSIQTVYTHGSFVVNPNNTRAVVGFSSHVFVGRVVEQKGFANNPSDRPQTFFSAEVVDIIKGNLPKDITLAQFAFQDKGMLIIEEGETFLQPGQTYLFVTRHDDSTNRYSIFPGGYGNIQIADDTQKADLIKKYREAYKNELPFDPGHPRVEPTSDLKDAAPVFPYPNPESNSYPDPVSYP